METGPGKPYGSPRIGDEVKSLIINSPYEEPDQHLRRFGQGFAAHLGRRPPGYEIRHPEAGPAEDDVITIHNGTVEILRTAVGRWRAGGYAGVTRITRELLEHWFDRQEVRRYPFFFCQREAIETLIWLTEGPAEERQKALSTFEGDGGPFARYCCKMATGSGKTLVMAMTIVWNTLNKVAYPQDGRFSRHVLVMAPNLTVKERLKSLQPSAEESEYQEFHLLPSDGELERLQQARVVVANWQSLQWLSEEQRKRNRKVDKRLGMPLSDTAWLDSKLKDLGGGKNVLVLNDEAHHAWRKQGDIQVAREEEAVATVWINALDRLHKARRILRCYDFSATPYIPVKDQDPAKHLYSWIVSDFRLEDAIESGLVKIPRIPADDVEPDPETGKSKYYKLYTHVKDQLDQKSPPQDPLPPLVRAAYLHLGQLWRGVSERWKAEKRKHRPVMITVANRTDTAARVHFAFDTNVLGLPELSEPEVLLHVDTDALQKAESGKQPDRSAEELRKKMRTVGKKGKLGERIQNVISVGMLTEGWDTRTVTHIMGLRAFTSTLLCEQVVGRGLRRINYTRQKNGLFPPEYVDVFGVPFGLYAKQPKGKVKPNADDKEPVRIEVDQAKAKYKISWPNVVRINDTLKPQLKIDWDSIDPLVLDPHDAPLDVSAAPALGGQQDYIHMHDLRITGDFRLQTVIFNAALQEFHLTKQRWESEAASLAAQLVSITEQFIASRKIRIISGHFVQQMQETETVFFTQITKIVRHLIRQIDKPEINHSLEMILDSEKETLSTGNMSAWYTTRTTSPAERSHINLCVLDSEWEGSEAGVLDTDPRVEAWAKNDHLGFKVNYLHQGVERRYYPDFLVKLKNGENLVLEVKGQEVEKEQDKIAGMERWRDAVNQSGAYGRWHYEVSRRPLEVYEILERLCGRQGE